MAKKTKMPFGLNPVEYEVRVEPEDSDYHGGFSDPRDVQWVTDQLNSGNELAWCWVEVKATFEGYSGSDSLGGCFYKSMRSLERDLIPKMKENALADLKARIKAIADNAVKDAQESEAMARAALKVLAGVKS